MKKISVVIPTYKRPQLLSKCLTALLNQDFHKQQYEIIVISDGPDVLTDHILKTKFLSSCPPVRYCPLFEKKGPAAARNKGWQLANGDLIAFTDDDCLPQADWLTQIWNMYNKEELVAFSGSVIVPRSEQPTDFEVNTSQIENADFISENCVCTKKALELTGGFDERFTTAWREDSDLQFKLLTAAVPIKKNPSAVVVHPVRKSTWGISILEQKKGMFNALLYKKYPALYRQKIKSWVRYNYYFMILCFAGAVVFSGLQQPLPASVAGLVWVCLTACFIAKRLEKTSHRLSHVIEIVLTSIVIPFTSVFWHLYGAIKYKVLFV